MNIFDINENVELCASEHIDLHVIKMCTEYAQLLSTAHRVLDGHETTVLSQNGRRIKTWMFDDIRDYQYYKSCHVNHPSNIWVRKRASHYRWLFNLWRSLNREYTFRYGKIHKTMRVLHDSLYKLPQNISHEGAFERPYPAMSKYPECVVEGDNIKSYRNFYWADKQSFATWKKRDKPEWWKEYERKRIETETPVCVAN